MNRNEPTIMKTTNKTYEQMTGIMTCDFDKKFKTNIKISKMHDVANDANARIVPFNLWK